MLGPAQICVHNASWCTPIALRFASGIAAFEKLSSLEVRAPAEDYPAEFVIARAAQLSSKPADDGQKTALQNILWPVCRGQWTLDPDDIPRLCCKLSGDFSGSIAQII